MVGGLKSFGYALFLRGKIKSNIDVIVLGFFLWVFLQFWFQIYFKILFYCQTLQNTYTLTNRRYPEMFFFGLPSIIQILVSFNNYWFVIILIIDMMITNYLKLPVILYLVILRLKVNPCKCVNLCQVNKEFQKLFFHLFSSLIITIFAVFNILSGILIFSELMQFILVENFTFCLLACFLKLCTI